MSNTVGLVLMAIGLAFNLVGCIGLIRLPDIYNRLQAATKCVTMGTCAFLIGTMFLVTGVPAVVKCVLCIGFILVTSPTAAHALARGAYSFGVKLWEKSVTDAYAEKKRGGGGDAGAEG
jgi:multicomponent Na+:H+ antiporter subunit G